jgi:hypothetical protein
MPTSIHLPPFTSPQLWDTNHPSCIISAHSRNTLQKVQTIKGSLSIDNFKCNFLYSLEVTILIPASRPQTMIYD